MAAPQPTPSYYRPDEVAHILRCSAWWIKEQARKRRIPYAWIGGGYLFTDQHIAEIVRRFEVRPTDAVPTIPAPRRPIEQSSNVDGDGSHVRLVARKPRRTRGTTLGTAA